MLVLKSGLVSSSISLLWFQSLSLLTGEILREPWAVSLAVGGGESRDIGFSRRCIITALSINALGTVCTVFVLYGMYV